MLSRLVCLEHNHDKDDARVTTPWWLMLPYHVDPRGSHTAALYVGQTRRRERAGVRVLAAVAAVRRAVRGGRGVARVAPGGLVEGHRL